ncbi:MAG: riboflavin biosynthesis protein RibF [Deltaproteobacteria bacterium]
MKVTYGIGGLERFTRTPKSVTIGVFDGVHRGHLRVLDRVHRDARRRGVPAAVVTFALHPSHTLRRAEAVRHLTSLTHKLLLLEQAGMDLCCVLPFDRRLADLPAEAFIRDILVAKLHTVALHVGEDFVFGRGARGDIRTLAAAARRYGFRFRALPHLTVAGRIVSSTRIRGLVEKGALKDAARLLGRPVSLLGRVVRGEGRGRTLGFPTANLCVEHEALVPDGVYAGLGRLVVSTVSGRARAGASSAGFRVGPWRPCGIYVGRKPTFHRKAPRGVEVFFWHKEAGRLRGRFLEAECIRLLRRDRRFRDPADLIRQMGRDIARARSVLKRFK